MPLDYTSITSSDQLNIDADLDFQNHKGVNVANGTSAQDIATKGQLDAAIAALSFLSAANFVFNEVPTGSMPGTSFTIANTPVAGTVTLYKNGLLLTPGVSQDYTISGTTITTNSSVKSNDRLLVNYIK
jgi:hypothetical protein